MNVHYLICYSISSFQNLKAIKEIKFLHSSSISTLLLISFNFQIFPMLYIYKCNVNLPNLPNYICNVEFTKKSNIII